ncbi:MAG TPA: hypothetical protein VLN58_06070, partial [Verrucomicrobiae bacterium]|nr:hypothetical protein [Verrucomicrobiae bacterium]
MAALASTATKSNSQRGTERDMARGLTLLTFRRDGELHLGAKSEKGILDVPHAAQMLNLHAPATMDELLQQEDGPA